MHPLLLATLLSLPADAATAEKGEPAPKVRGTTVAHGPMQLGELKGEIVVLSFWASWCPPCLTDLDILAAEDKALREEGIRIITVNVDQSHEAEAVDALVAVRGWEMPVIRDPRSRVLGTYFSTRSVPVSAVIDHEGVLRELHLSWDEGDAQQVIEEARALRAEADEGADPAAPADAAGAAGEPAAGAEGADAPPADDAPAPPAQ
jgi:thiol-disulfide isomerase/thioredoxin